MSLAGIPPFAGFFLKLAGVFMVVNKFPLLLGVLIVRTMVRLYFYLNIFFRRVFCVGSIDYGILSSSLLEYKIPAAVLFLSILN